MSDVILLTGGTGFVGKQLYSALIKSYQVLCALRNKRSADFGECVEISEIDKNTQWRGILSGVNCIINWAARVLNGDYQLHRIGENA